MTSPESIKLLTSQVNQILHAPEFQALEAAWRGLHYVWSTREQMISERGFDERNAQVEIRILDVSKRELQRDFEKAADFDQNSLFKKVYEEEFGMAGGTPYGVLLANYEIYQPIRMTLTCCHTSAALAPRPLLR